MNAAPLIQVLAIDLAFIAFLYLAWFVLCWLLDLVIP